MKLLIDTHLLLWSSIAVERVPDSALQLIKDPANDLMFSAVSIWEVAIKRARGRSDFDVDPAVLRRALIDVGYAELPVTSDHAIALLGLPPLHRDPFDRLLVAQARAEGVVLVTSDQMVAQYPGAIRLV